MVPGRHRPVHRQQGPRPSTNGQWAHRDVRTCRGADPDTNCRDRFRWELTRDKITVYANGVKLLEHTAKAGKHLVPDSILNGDLYVY